MKHYNSLVGIVMAVLSLAILNGCDLLEKEQEDPQIRIQVESDVMTRYFTVGRVEGTDFFPSSEWIIASGGYSEYVSVEEGEYVFCFDDSADHSEVSIICYKIDMSPVYFSLENNKKYTVIFGADGNIHFPDFSGL